MKKKLEWGQTPWDDLPREELLLRIRRMYAAIMTAHTALRLVSHGARDGFWSEEGTGGDALLKMNEVLETEHSAYEPEDIYRSYFRYAADLLFSGDGSGWCVCPVCGRMYGKSTGGELDIGGKCGDILPTGCQGELRRLTWEDLAPKKAEKDSGTHDRR